MTALFVKPEQTTEFYKYAANILNLCDIEHMSSAADCEFHHNLERKKRAHLDSFFRSLRFTLDGLLQALQINYQQLRFQIGYQFHGYRLDWSH